MENDLPIRLKAGLVALGVCALSLSVPQAAASTVSIPPSTALPVRFVKTVDAANVHAGDEIVTRTMQVVLLPDGRRLPKNTLVKGHIVKVRPYHSASASQTKVQSSELSIHFDQIELGTEKIPVNLCVRALANVVASSDASSPHHLDETDSLGTMTLIGGDEFSPIEKKIRNDDGSVIGSNRKDGVFAQLLTTSDITSGDNHKCSGTSTEQSVAIFSPGACGIYGFGDEMSMPEAGRSGSGTFTLVSQDHSVKLYGGSTALLQQAP